MSWSPANEPVCTEADGGVERVLAARARDLGGIAVRRVLPAPGRRTVGPFIFFDEMGPAALPPGAGVDVRPHPHIHLATVTYLFEGELVHRDSLGSLQPIRPGDVNWMVAGRGIVHSERSAPEARRAGARLHGLQLWVALPRAHEDTAPSFEHHPAETLPALGPPGARVRLLAGTAYGLASPVRTLSPLGYLAAELDAGAAWELPDDHPERAAYVVAGAVGCGGRRFEAGRLVVFGPGRVVLRADGPARVAVIGGAPLDGPRYIDWNFVSSSRERIEQAKLDWEHGRFATIPGDDRERIPLPR